MYVVSWLGLFLELRDHQSQTIPTPCGPIAGPRFDTEDRDDEDKFAKNETEPNKQVRKIHNAPKHDANKTYSPDASMVTNENLCLRWKVLQSKVSPTFKQLREE